MWELGEVYRGPWAQNYWSSTGCLFHHAYPVGYRASKPMFNRSWDMRIVSGDIRPTFEVCMLACVMEVTARVHRHWWHSW